MSALMPLRCRAYAMPPPFLMRLMPRAAQYGGGYFHRRFNADAARTPLCVPRERAAMLRAS